MYNGGIVSLFRNLWLKYLNNSKLILSRPLFCLFFYLSSIEFSSSSCTIVFASNIMCSIFLASPLGKSTKRVWFPVRNCRFAQLRFISQAVNKMPRSVVDCNKKYPSLSSLVRLSIFRILDLIIILFVC